MTTGPQDFAAYFDFQKRALAPFLELNEFVVRTFERAARHGYEATGEALDYGIAQARAALTARDPQQLAARQAQLATEFVGRQTERTNEWLKIAVQAQAEMGKWAQAANDELTAAVRKSA
ncbi:MAG: phasin family protein [Gammaproteobacteria bacterium]|nr:phasin family protein [Gammaproteobacteria bacterium]